MRKMIGLLLMLLISPISNIHAEEKKSPTNNGIVPLGAPYYTPDSSLGLGGIIVFYFENELNLTNEITFAGTYTLKSQYSLALDYTFFTWGDTLLIKGLLHYADFPQLYFGKGPTTEENSSENFRPISINFEPKFLVKRWEHLYFGPALHYNFTSIKEKVSDGLIVSENAVGHDSSKVIGMGFNLNWDFRNSSFFPTAGGYLDLKHLWYRKQLGSDTAFRRLDLDVRYFLSIADHHIFAFQTLWQSTFGDTPFTLLPHLGGDNQMRGYLDGRYRDNHCAFFQTEYRFPIIGILGGVVFGAVGEVAPNIESLGTHPHFSYGTGLRLTVDEKEHINIRLDFGINEEGNVDFYFIAKEAF